MYLQLYCLCHCTTHSLKNRLSWPHKLFWGIWAFAQRICSPPAGQTDTALLFHSQLSSLACSSQHTGDWFSPSTHKPCQGRLFACPELLRRQTRLGSRASNPRTVGLFLFEGTGAAEELLWFLWRCSSARQCLAFAQHSAQSVAQPAKLQLWDWPYQFTSN